jgi:mRNA interferase HicA
MKRLKLIKHLEKHGCVFVREGANHTIFQNPNTNKTSAIPRHSEIADILALKICKQLEVPSLK